MMLPLSILLCLIGLATWKKYSPNDFTAENVISTVALVAFLFWIGGQL
jgi:hypothetical protein